MISNKKIIRDIKLVQQFRNILFYELRILDSISLFIFFHFIGLLGVVTNMVGVSFESLVMFLVILAALGAIIFTPYIFYVLIKEKKFGWIIIYFVMVPIPEVIGYFVFKDTLAFEAALLIPLAFFYFYCYLIKYEVDKWFGEYNWHQERMQQKKETEDRLKNVITNEVT